MTNLDLRLLHSGLAVVLMALQATIASAQLAPPNAAGVAMGHLHYRVRDLDANTRFWVALGGRLVPAEGRTVVKFPDVLVFLEEGEAPGGTEGSVVNHVAFRVPSFAAVEAAGLTVTRLGARFPGVGGVQSPDGERIELFENAATNLTFTQDDGGRDAVAERHNRPLDQPVAFHHVHLYVPAGQVAEAKRWYAAVFGGVAGKRSTYDAVDLPGINLNFSEAPRAVVATRGRRLDHVGFEVQGLAAFCRRLEAMGVIFDVPFAADRGPGASAAFTDPWGTSIELTEGLRGL